jgi:hypothetical protein
VLLLFSIAVFLSAALLFFVEPMFARMILPLLGGAPAVWNTCVVFYQVLLFAGYAYAHLIARRLQPRVQALSHIAWLAVALALLPIAVGPSWTPPASANPIGWVFTLLVAVVGVPFFVLATSGPLLQRWFASLGHRASANPYMLYASSNFGSLLALLAYPLLIEPSMRLRTQSVAWTVLYGVFVAVAVLCAVAIWRTPAAHIPAATTPTSSAKRSHTDAGEDVTAMRVGWLALAFVPSTLMLSVTTYITTDVAAVPLLWVLPLSLYLLTFVLAFAARQWIPRWLLEQLAPLAMAGTVALVLAQNVFPVLATIAWHLLGFFVIALFCHQRLAASRPHASRLTEFYLWVSAGGALGGLFNTLVAPVLFVRALEYPLMAISVSLLLPGVVFASEKLWRRAAVILAVVMPTALLSGTIALLHVVDDRIPQVATIRYAFVFLAPLLAALLLRRKPLAMGLALALLLFQGSFVRFDNRVPLFIERTFYGEHRVLFTGKERVLTSGTTNHGAQSIRPDLACEPLTYYSRLGPVGQVMDSLSTQPNRTRFGVVGLGTGSLGAYASPGQTWTFFEINPAIERIARDPEYFTYLSTCAPQATVVIGDARLSLERIPDSSFDVLFVDAFSSDAIPVHLMTTEAMQLYFRKLAPGGILALHISNRYLALTPVVAGVAKAAGLVAAVQVHQPTDAQLTMSSEITVSRWTILARHAADFGALRDDPRWQTLDTVDGPAWTDDYSNVFDTIRW